MSGDASRNESRLDTALRDLSREVAPGRDLWPQIEARLEPSSRPVRRTWAWQAAAALLLVAASSLLTAKFMAVRAPSGTIAATPAPTVSTEPAAPVAMPAAFGPRARLDAEYAAARRQLTTLLQARLQSMPASTRAKLELNLAEMRRAADEINAALDEQPGDPLLEELLLETYQEELAVLANVSQLTTRPDTPVEKTPAAKRIAL